MASLTEFLGARFYEACPKEFYRELFPSGCLQKLGNESDGRYCAIGLSVPRKGMDGEKVFPRRYLIGDALDNLDNAVTSDDFTIIAPISYVGKSRRGANARELYALVFDLDKPVVSGSGEQVGLENIFGRVEDLEIPEPTYVVASGSGCHLYYMLDKPIRLFPSTIEAIDRYRIAITNLLWTDYITTLWDKIQYEGTLQGFRAVGSICKDGEHRVRAFRTGKKLSVEELDMYVEPKDRMQGPYVSKSGKSLEQAQKLWPEWFEDVVVNGNKRNGTYHTNRAFYDWWKKQIQLNFKVGHRYWCIYSLAIVAQKCGIEEDELIHDAFALREHFNRRRVVVDEPFTEDDVMAAVSAFDKPRIMTTAAKLSRMTDIQIPKRKRNGRKLSTHLAICRFQRDLNNPNGTWRGEGNRKGAPTKEALVRDYLSRHPDASHSQIARDLGVSRPTAIKWANVVRDVQESSGF